MQDLGTVNETVICAYPLVPKAYTLLTHLPGFACAYTSLCPTLCNPMDCQLPGSAQYFSISNQKKRHTSLYSPPSRLSIPFCCWMEGPWHSGGCPIYKDSAAGLGGQPPSFWKCISKGNEGPEPGEGSSAYNMLIIVDNRLVRLDKIQIKILFRALYFLAKKGYKASSTKVQISQ